MVGRSWLFHNCVVHPICGVLWFVSDVSDNVKLGDWADAWHEKSSPGADDDEQLPYDHPAHVHIRKLERELHNSFCSAGGWPCPIGCESWNTTPDEPQP